MQETKEQMLRIATIMGMHALTMKCIAFATTPNELYLIVDHMMTFAAARNYPMDSNVPRAIMGLAIDIAQMEGMTLKEAR